MRLSPHIKESKSRIFLRFLRFGLLAWGGPIAQIAMIRQELVEEEKWISNEQFNRTLAIYQALPGPEAHELCVYFGMVAGGRWGGILAGIGFMLPGFVLMLLLTWLYTQFSLKSHFLQYVFFGFQAAVIALIFMATYRIGKHALINLRLLAITIVSAIATFVGVSFIVVLPLAGLIYLLLIKRNIAVAYVIISVVTIYIFSISIQDGFRFHSALDPGNATTSNGFVSSSPWFIFFSGLKGGLLTFGGAYTVIPFVQQDAVLENGWMTNDQFLDGIALSGILPAPLIIFTTFVGYYAGGWLGSFVITIGIFLPAFCFSLIGHRFIDRVLENKSLHNFLDGITAGVIGLIGITAIQLFSTVISTVGATIIFSIALLVLYVIKSKYTPVFVIFGSGLISLIYKLLS